MIANLVILVLTIRVVVTHNRKRSVIKSTVKTIINITCIIVIFGLTWLFGALTISGASRVFQYLFVITSGFQGFYIFLFICVINEDGRELWVNVITGKLKKKRTTLQSHSKAQCQDAKKTQGGILTTGVGEGPLSPSSTGPNYFKQHLRLLSSDSSNAGLPGDLDKGTTKKTNEMEMSLVINNETVIANEDKDLLCQMEEAPDRHNDSEATVGDKGDHHSQHSNESDLEYGITFKDGIMSIDANTDHISNSVSLDGFSIPISSADLALAPVRTQLETTHDKVEIMANPNSKIETEMDWHVLQTTPSFEKHTKSTTLSPDGLVSPTDHEPLVAMDPQGTHDIDALTTADPDIEKGRWENTPSGDEEEGNLV